MRTRFKPDRGLTGRMVATGFLLGLLYVVFVAVLIVLTKSAFLAIVIAGALLFSQYWFSDRIALYAMHGQVVTPEQAPQLHGVIDRLCALADMPKPAVAVADSDLPTASATGRSPSKAVENALGRSESATATAGFGMSASAHSRTMTPCSWGACSGVTTWPCIAYNAMRSENQYWLKSSAPAITMARNALFVRTKSTATKTTYSSPSRNPVATIRPVRPRSGLKRVLIRGPGKRAVCPCSSANHLRSALL